MLGANKLIEQATALAKDPLNGLPNTLNGVLAKTGIGEQLNLDALDNLSISKMVDLKGLLGDGIDFGGFTGLSDCFKSVDQIISDKLGDAVNKVSKGLIDSPLGKGAGAALAGIQKAGEAIQKVSAAATAAVEKVTETLSSLVAKAQSAVTSYIKKLGIIQKITDIYGATIGKIGEFISKIQSFNPCKLLNNKGEPEAEDDLNQVAPGATQHPRAIVVPEGEPNPDIPKPLATPAPGPPKPIENPGANKDPKAAPKPGSGNDQPSGPAGTPVNNINRDVVQVAARAATAKMQIGDIVNDTAGLDMSKPESLALVNSLQGISRTLTTHLTSGVFDIGKAKSFVAEQRETLTKTLGGGLLGRFDFGIDQLFDTFDRGLADLTEMFNIDNLLGGRDDDDDGDSTNTPAEPNHVGTIVIKGIGMTSGACGDYMKLLRLIPDERPKELIDYWTNWGGKCIETDLEKLRKRNVKIEYQTLAEQTIGSYDIKFESGLTCVNNKYKGGTTLRLENYDGSIYDPGGINPSGMITVAGSDKTQPRLDESLDIYLDKDMMKIYKGTMGSVQVRLVRNGEATDCAQR